MTYVAAIIGFILGAVICGLVVYLKQRYEAQVWKTKFELLNTSLEDKKANEAMLEKNLTLRFENLAQKIFDDKSTKMTDLNLQQINGILSPLKERIKDFEKKVEDTYSSERSERGFLKGEISKLIELNHNMSKEAHNLALALKGENKTQGNWGEMILENILERSGLRKNEEYFVQETLKNSTGDILRPDIIVQLPDEKHLIVDSKMTLNAYESAVNATNDEDRERFSMAHIEALKRHINELSEKKYHAADKVISPDFVMLFMPLEPAFAMAFRLKPELFEQAWDKNVAIVSPTTLLATLRTVASLWKQERQQRNALEIAKRGGELYDKFAGIVKDLEVLGDRLTSTQKAHADVMSKVFQGRGNLISQVEKLKELGAKADKSLPPPND